MAYNTGNAIGSADARDLYDNAQNLDKAMNSTDPTWIDRFGVARPTFKGAESELNQKVGDAEAAATQALGYLNTMRATSYGPLAEDPTTDPLGNPCTAGDEYFNTTYNLLKRFDGSIWRVPDINTENLASGAGSSLVGHGGQTVEAALNERLPEIGNYAGLDAYTGDATAVLVYGVQNIFDGGAGIFRRTTDTPSAANGIYRQDSVERWWKRDYAGAVIPRWFGAVGDGVKRKLSSKFASLAAAQAVYSFATSLDQTLDWAGIQAAINACPVRGKVDATGLHLVFDDTNLTASMEQDGQKITVKAGITIDFSGSRLDDGIPIVIDCDDSTIIGGHFVDTVSTSGTIKRFGFTIRSSKRVKWHGSRFERVNAVGNNTAAQINSYMQWNGSAWVEGTGSQQRINEDVEFVGLTFVRYGQMQVIGGKDFRFRGITYVDGPGDDAIVFKTQKYDATTGSGPFRRATISGCVVNGMSAVFATGGACYSEFPISDISCSASGGNGLSHIALLKTTGNTGGATPETTGGMVSDITIAACWGRGLTMRSVLGVWASNAGKVRNVNVNGVNVIGRSGTYLGSRKGVFLLQLHDLNGTGDSVVDTLKFNGVTMSSGTDEFTAAEVAASYGLGGLIDYVTLPAGLKNFRFNEITLDGLHVNGTDFTVTSAQNISAGHIKAKLESGATTIAGSYKYLTRNLPIERLDYDANGAGKSSFANLVYGTMTGGAYNSVKQMTVFLPATEANGTFDLQMPVPESMYLLKVRLIQTTTLAANASNFLAFRFYRNAIIGGAVDMFTTAANTITAGEESTVFMDITGSGNKSDFWMFKQGELLRLQGLVTGTVAQQKNMAFVFEYIPVNYQ